MEKHHLNGLPDRGGPVLHSGWTKNFGLFSLMTIVCLIVVLDSTHILPSGLGRCLIPSSFGRHRTADGWCPLPNATLSGDDGLESSDHLMSHAQLQLQVERLTAAVRVPTESFDDNGDVDEDPRWETFEEFHHVLKELFPLVYVACFFCILCISDNIAIDTRISNSVRSTVMDCNTH